LLDRTLVPHRPDDDGGLLGLGLVVVRVVRDVPTVLDVVVVARVLVCEATLFGDDCGYGRGGGGGGGGRLLGVLVGRCICVVDEAR
jgi:hypothetical protein